MIESRRERGRQWPPTLVPARHPAKRGTIQVKLKLLERLKRSIRRGPKSAARRDCPRRRGSYYESVVAKEVADASPERAGELAGHPTERVET